MNANQYLLVLPPGIDRDTFLCAHAAQLRETGYVAFPWSNSVNGKPMQLKYKVWVDLKGMSPCSWTIEHLLRAAGSFGIVLEHGPLACVPSLERMRAVIAVPDLALVSENTTVWVRGIARVVHVDVLAWIEELIPFTPPKDTTPPSTFFEQIRCNPAATEAGTSQPPNSQDSLVVDFDTLFAIWITLPKEKRDERERLEIFLQNSPLFEASKETAAATTQPQTAGKPSPSDPQFFNLPNGGLRS